MKIKTINDPVKFRANVRNQLNTKFNDDKNALNLEIGILNWSLKEANVRKVIKKWDNPYFIKIYLDRLKSVWINISNELIQDVNNKHIQPHQIAFMTAQEFNPKKWEPLIQEKIQRDKVKYEVNLEAATDTFKCRKCNPQNVLIIKCKQDQPMNQ